MDQPKRDNVTLSQKVMLRQTALRLLGDEEPVILETHGGRGDVWSACYSHVAQGVVFDKDAYKVDILTHQRPTWAVYEADVEIALAGGAGRHLTFNFMDVDPYGACWPALDAYFGSRRTFAPRMVLALNDGLRYAAIGAAWRRDILAPYVSVYGNHNIWNAYPREITADLMARSAERAGYRVATFESYTAGHSGKMVHMLVVLERDAA